MEGRVEERGKRSAVESIPGLRELFLQRKGFLPKQSEHTLVVQHEAFKVSCTVHVERRIKDAE